MSRNYRDPEWWIGNALPRGRAKALEAVDRAYVGIQRRRGVDAPVADWDNLLVLDACRYDASRAVDPIDGDLRRVRSRGSATSEWLRENSYDRTCHDTVYVTASPMHSAGTWVAPPGVDASPDVLADVFHDVIELWRDSDPELRTTRPETVAGAALEAAERYPDERLLVHFMQPHYPFIGPYAREREIGTAGFARLRRLAETGELEDDDRDAWELLRDGEYGHEPFERACRENLDVTLPHVQRLVDALDGRTVVTSDHGNAFGGRAPPFGERLWGHPPGYQTAALTRVPWLVATPGADRRETVAEPPVETERPPDAGDGAVAERLRDSGYV